MSIRTSSPASPGSIRTTAKTSPRWSPSFGEPSTWLAQTLSPPRLLRPDSRIRASVSLYLVQPVALPGVQVILLLVAVGRHIKPVRPRPGKLFPNRAVLPLAAVQVGAEGRHYQPLIAQIF